MVAADYIVVVLASNTPIRVLCSRIILYKGLTMNELTSSNGLVLKKKVFILQMHITDRCNLRCTHCYQNDLKSSEVTADQIVRIVDQFCALCQQLGRKGQLTFTGGEPFVRSDFLRILETVASQYRELRIAILTNGTLLTDAIAARLALLSPVFVQVSLDGNETTHDSIRGAGNYARALNSLQLLHAHSIRSLVSFTAHQQNFHDFPAVVDAAARAGVTRVWTDRLVPFGKGEHLSVMTPAQTQEFFQIVHEEQLRCEREEAIATQVTMKRALQFLLTNQEPYRCSAGRRLLAVLPDGLVYPCRRLPIPVGNVLSSPLQEIYRQARKLMQREALCTTCQHAKSCAGGLRCLAYAIMGDLSSPDPGCWLPGANACACSS
jgi:radical SAM protein with 4Fe4S-binding SPASM domain